MLRYVGLNNYIEIQLLHVEKWNNLGESKYDWYVELVDLSNFYHHYYLYLIDEHPPSLVGIFKVVDVLTENLLCM